MKKRFKILSILIAYCSLLIFDGCISTDDDGCNFSRQALPYYDFQKIEISTSQNEVAENQSLEISLALKELSYLANLKPCFSLGLINKTWACSPLPDGYDGAKFPIEKIEVFSNKDFNADFPANSLLNEIVFIEVFSASGTENKKLSEASNENLNFDEPEYFSKVIFIEARPEELNIEHELTFKLTKSNGDIVEEKLPNIIWK